MYQQEFKKESVSKTHHKTIMYNTVLCFMAEAFAASDSRPSNVKQLWNFLQQYVYQNKLGKK